MSRIGEQHSGPQGRGKPPSIYFGDCSDFAVPGGMLRLADLAGLRLRGDRWLPDRTVSP